MRFNLQFNLSLSKLFLMIRSGSRRIILRYDLAARLSRIVRCGPLRQLLNKWKTKCCKKQNIMKTNRVLLTFLLVVMALCAHAGDNNSALRKSIAMANAMCPVSLGAIEMTSMVYEKGDLIISYALNEDVISVETLKNNKEMVRQNATTMVRNATGDLKTTFDLLASEGAGLVMKYIGKQSKTKFTIRFTAEEILRASIAPEEARDPMAALKSQIEVGNAMLPTKIADGMEMPRAYLEDDYLFYEVTVDEDLLSIANIKSNRPTLKKNILAVLNSDDVSTKALKDLCKSVNVGIAYKYVGKDSRQTATVRITPAEL